MERKMKLTAALSLAATSCLAVLWGFYVFLITSLLAAAFDSMFVMMQRYNRARILKLIK